VYQNGARYTLEKIATANDRTNAWAQENDMTAPCKKLEGDRKLQCLDPIKEDGEAESAVEEVNEYILPKIRQHAQELEKQIPQILRQAAGSQGQGRHRTSMAISGTRLLPGEEEMLATAEEKECKHRAIDGLRMLSVEEREKSIVKWLVGYSAEGGICEKKIEIGEPHKRCQMCKTVRCRRSEWTLKYRGD
jgi:hypothetical protein